MTRQVAIWAGGAVWAAAYFAIPPGAASEAVWNLGTWGVAGLLVLAVARMPAPRTGWAAIAAAVCCTTLGDAVFSYHAVVLDVSPFPTIGDAFYVAGYPLMAVGLTRMARGGGRRRPHAVIDGLIVAGAAAAGLWTVLVVPILGDAAAPLQERLIAAAYPVGDLLLLVTAAQLVAHRPHPSPALRLLLLGIGANLLADVVFLLDQDGTGYAIGDPVDLAWLIGYVAILAAASHPSATRIAGGADVDAAAGLPIARLLLLAVAALAAPVLHTAFEVLRVESHHLSLLVATLVLFSLVIARLWLIARDLERSRRELRHRATHDDLTGLPNRALFDEALAEAQRAGLDVVVLILDIDRFKQVNDTLGHHVGDAVLREVADRLRARLPAGAVPARLGGDEFAVLLPPGISAEPVAMAVVEAMRRPVDVSGYEVLTSVSCGAAHLADGHVLRRADEALYQAKYRGRDGHVIGTTASARRDEDIPAAMAAGRVGATAAG